MKRFWTTVEVAREDGGWGIRLDERPVRTPARVPLKVPTESLAEAIRGKERGVNVWVETLIQYLLLDQ